MWPPIIITTIILITTRVSLAPSFIAPNSPAVSSNYVRLGSVKIEPPTTKTTIESGTARTTTTTAPTLTTLDPDIRRAAYLALSSKNLIVSWSDDTDTEYSVILPSEDEWSPKPEDLEPFKTTTTTTTTTTPPLPPPPTMTTTMTTVPIDLDEFLDRQAYLSRVSRWGKATTAPISEADEEDFIDLLPAWTPGEPMVLAKEEEDDYDEYDDYTSSMPPNNGNQGPNGEGNVVGGEEDSETEEDENEATNEPTMTPKPTVTYYTETTMETATIYTPPPLTSWIYPPPASSISRAYNFMVDIELLLVVDILVGCYFPMFQLRQV